MRFNLFQEIIYSDPSEIFSQFAGEDGALFLDSAGCARYSFIAVSPFSVITSKNEAVFLDGKKIDAHPLAVLETEWKKFPLVFEKELPPFQGGAAGFFSYDFCHQLEEIKSQQKDEMNFPDMVMGLYDVVIAFDLEKKRAWIFSSGYPEQDFNQRELRAKKRLEFFLEKIKNKFQYDSKKIAAEKIHSNFSSEGYQAAVEKVKNYIRDGDIFEANISQCFSAELQNNSSFDLYQQLRKINPAPFSAFFKWNEFAIASASPERFLKLTHHEVEARPIKGTRARDKNLEKDKMLARELLQSEKDRAENVMIVDLLRNDLSRVCEPHSVKVPVLCGLESYTSVHHLVSVVTGKLKNHFNGIDLLRATFPGGSITGAPKIRAMEIISEMEPTRRGIYCGSLGYFGFNGDLDFSILIRTFGIKNNRVTFQAGGAVVLDSDSLQEYEETLTKVKKLAECLT